MAEHLQQQLQEFHQQMISKIRTSSGEGEAAVEESPEGLPIIKTDEDEGWVDKLAGFVVRVPPPLPAADEKAGLRGEGMKFYGILLNFYANLTKKRIQCKFCGKFYRKLILFLN